MPEIELDEDDKSRAAVLKQRYKDGKNLSRSQLKLIGKLGVESLAVNMYVTTKKALAGLLGCSETTIKNMMDKPGCPGYVDGGRYPIEAWKKWYPTVGKVNGGNHVTLEQSMSLSRIAELRAADEYEEWKFDRDIKRGKYILREDVKRQAAEAGAILRREIQQRFVQVAPAEMEACETVEERRAVLERHFSDLLEFIHLGEW